ncbi:MAG TPA: BrxA/BrxB family bacilliredoxin [Terriglobia bacterium]|nr:BrxA/BrxB family bacilliredoxin [Terriglobia bacterium]
MYPEQIVRPMQEELTHAGFVEMKTPAEVDSILGREKAPVLVVVNSICGCAAGKARPAVIQALNHANRPKVLTTVFAGQDTDATAQARSYFSGYEPSSPSIALLNGGKLVFMLERWQIEGRIADDIANDLTAAFDRFCVSEGAAVSA